MQRYPSPTAIARLRTVIASIVAKRVTTAIVALCAPLWVAACTDDDYWDRRFAVYELVRYDGDTLPHPATATAFVSETLVLTMSPDRALQQLVHESPSGPETVTRRLEFSRHEGAYYINFFCAYDSVCPGIYSVERGTLRGDTLVFATRGFPGRIYLRRR